MTKLRQDAWSHEDDLLLAQTVLQHIRDGSTQLKAFEEVGDTLNRTSAACGFRWNAEVRQRYEQAVAIAKKQRKDSKRTMAHTEKPKLHTNLSLLSFEKEVPPVSHKESTPQVRGTLKMEDVITFLHNLGHSNTEDAQLQHSHELLSAENEALKNEHNQLQQRYDTLLEQYASIQEDYQSLMKIMDRARKLVLFDDPAERMAPIFKMDNNGSIEIVSQ